MNTSLQTTLKAHIKALDKQIKSLYDERLAVEKVLLLDSTSKKVSVAVKSPKVKTIKNKHRTSNGASPAVTTTGKRYGNFGVYSKDTLNILTYIYNTDLEAVTLDDIRREANSPLSAKQIYMALYRFKNAGLVSKDADGFYITKAGVEKLKAVEQVNKRKESEDE